MKNNTISDLLEKSSESILNEVASSGKVDDNQLKILLLYSKFKPREDINIDKYIEYGKKILPILSSILFKGGK
jgi:hypothetical protein